jgi:signal transduction histidine kinase
MLLPRSVSAKLLLAIAVAVLVPFLGFAYFVSTAMGNRLSRDVVLYFLKSKASDLADKINLLLAERRKDLRIWVEEPVTRDLLSRPVDAGRRAEAEALLNTFCREKQVYDLLLLADIAGNVRATNTVQRTGDALPPGRLERLLAQDLRHQRWFMEAAEGRFNAVDWHVSPLLHDVAATPPDDPAVYAVGFAGPVRDRAGKIVGVWYNLMNWSFIQVDILDQVKTYFKTLQSPGSYQSGYAWLWKQDGDTIIAHKERSLYGRTVSGDPVFLPQLTRAARESQWDVFPEYEFPPGTLKNAAFRWTHTPAEGGFGWIVGLGINNDDILATVTELRYVLSVATVLILAGIVVWTWIISRTITGPVKSLIAFTEEVAKGNLDARVNVHTADEIGILARSFNRMAADLEASREKLIRAEKEAAWREMARQIAHEIKNPLTPMRLSTALLKKAYEDGSPDLPRIFEQTTETILTHIEALRRIAVDFSSFAGLPQTRPEPVAVLPVVTECLNLYEGWAKEKRIVTAREGEDGVVIADREELRRLFINLLENAFEAVGADGSVRVVSHAADGWLAVEVVDSGPGIRAEMQARLFQPYFSTKTTGTGLGLAICHRIVTEMRGTITLVSEAGRGTTARVRLPLEPPAPEVSRS